MTEHEIKSEIIEALTVKYGFAPATDKIDIIICHNGDDYVVFDVNHHVYTWDGYTLQFRGYEVHVYGMLHRPYGPMCQPMNGLITGFDSGDARFFSVIVYDRELTNNEISAYELEVIR